MDLTFQIDTEDSKPLYQQLYQFVKSEIQAGKIGMKEKLPSKRKLSVSLGLSQNTIQSAYDQLIQEGYVTPSERRGFYVNRIENLARLDGALPAAAEEQKAEAHARYDFSYTGVDPDCFPYALWRRLYKETVDENDRGLLLLGESQGRFELRAAIAGYLHQSRGVACEAGQVVLGSGTEFLLQILILLFGQESVFGIENPGYERLGQQFGSNHVQYRPIDIDGGGMVPQKIEESGAGILCLTPAHQFPSGEIMPISRRVQILNWANAQSGRYVIEDDYDGEFKYSGKPVPALQGLDQGGKVIYMGAFSKSLSPAVRVSYMVLPEALLNEYRRSLSYMICPVPGIEQKMMARFIAEGYFERHLNRMRTIYKKKRELLVECIKAMRCPARILGADAGLHLLVRVENGMTEERLLGCAESAGVKVYGISGYYIGGRRAGAPHILLGYASLAEKDIARAVEVLDGAWS